MLKTLKVSIYISTFYIDYFQEMKRHSQGPHFRGGRGGHNTFCPPPQYFVS